MYFGTIEGADWVLDSFNSFELDEKVRSFSSCKCRKVAGDSWRC
jgi:hypothetical protein